TGAVRTILTQSPLFPDFLALSVLARYAHGIMQPHQHQMDRRWTPTNESAGQLSSLTTRIGAMLAATAEICDPGVEAVNHSIAIRDRLKREPIDGLTRPTRSLKPDGDGLSVPPKITDPATPPHGHVIAQMFALAKGLQEAKKRELVERRQIAAGTR